MAAHPIVGLWRQVTTAETPPSLRALNAIHGDGTLTSLHSFGGTGVVTWEATDKRAVQWLLMYFNIADVPGQFEEGTVTVFGTLTVDDTGDTVTEASTIEISAADGTVVATFPYQSTFVRVPVAAPAMTGTPEAATPVA
jgi:hypothetical protein